nr:translation initiation factor IF-2-like isoform X2 [Equus asinus]
MERAGRPGRAARSGAAGGRRCSRSWSGSPRSAPAGAELSPPGEPGAGAAAAATATAAVESCDDRAARARARRGRGSAPPLPARARLAPGPGPPRGGGAGRGGTWRRGWGRCAPEAAQVLGDVTRSRGKPAGESTRGGMLPAPWGRETSRAGGERETGAAQARSPAVELGLHCLAGCSIPVLDYRRMADHHKQQLTLHGLIQGKSLNRHSLAKTWHGGPVFLEKQTEGTSGSAFAQILLISYDCFVTRLCSTSEDLIPALGREDLLEN